MSSVLPIIYSQLLVGGSAEETCSVLGDTCSKGPNVRQTNATARCLKFRIGQGRGHLYLHVIRCVTDRWEKSLTRSSSIKPHYKEGKGWLCSEAADNYNLMKEMQSEPVIED